MSKARRKFVNGRKYNRVHIDASQTRLPRAICIPKYTRRVLVNLLDPFTRWPRRRRGDPWREYLPNGAGELVPLRFKNSSRLSRLFLSYFEKQCYNRFMANESALQNYVLYILCFASDITWTVSKSLHVLFYDNNNESLPQ